MNPLRHVFLANEAETVSWRGHTLCLLCFEQFGLPQVIEDGDPEHHRIYHVVLPERLTAAQPKAFQTGGPVDIAKMRLVGERLLP